MPKKKKTKRSKEPKNSMPTEVTPSPQAKTINYQEALDRLVSLGKRQGYLTYEQINNHLPPEIVSSEKIEEVITALTDKNIELTTNSIQRGEGQDEKGEAKKGKEFGDEPKEPAEEFERVRMDDPVRTYLRQMGQIALLTRSQEIALAKRIEDAEEKLKAVVYETKAIRFEVLFLA